MLDVDTQDPPPKKLYQISCKRQRCMVAQNVIRRLNQKIEDRPDLPSKEDRNCLSQMLKILSQAKNMSLPKRRSKMDKLRLEEATTKIRRAQAERLEWE